jgi:indolepyruvate ferredoxin oxidoreductase, beta subunit
MTKSGPNPVRKRIFIAGVGGQGSITATVVIGEAVLAAGHNVVTSELHGMAQRGGVVQSTVLVGDLHAATISDGAADVLLGFEPAETLRFVAKAHRERTAIITNTHSIVPVSAAQGGTRYPTLDTILASLEAAGRCLVALDAVALATAAGTPKAISAVLVGALAGLDVLPVPRDCWIDALIARAPAQFRDVNVAAFDAGRQAAQTAQTAQSARSS